MVLGWAAGLVVSQSYLKPRFETVCSCNYTRKTQTLKPNWQHQQPTDQIEII
jgi:hypothetical protein